VPESLDTQALQAQPPAPDGWLLGGRYHVLDCLGRGGMAEVFRAHDDLLNRDVAVKVFKTVMDADGSTNGDARRELELQSLAQLNHPNLITLYDGSVAGDGPSYLVLELVDGPDLASRLKDGPLPEPQARELGAQIADALGYVHAHGMVHRDVKPANILLGRDDAQTLPGGMRARLSDFGIVRMIGSPQMTSADLTVGTAYYIAPEQARGSSVGPAADVYALGLVLLEAMTGVRAFDGPMHEALAARLAVAPSIPARLPEPWPGLLAAMTALDPADRPEAAAVAQQLRFGTTGAVAPVPAHPAAQTAHIGALAPAATAATAAVPAGPAAVAAMAGPAVAAAATGSGPTAPPRRRPPVGLWLAGLALLAAVVVGAFLWLGGNHATPADNTPSTSPSHHSPSVSSSSTKPKHSTGSSAGDRNNAPAAPKTSHSRTHATTKAAPSSTQASSSSRAQQPGPVQHSTTSAPPTTSSPPPSSPSASDTATNTAEAGGGAGGGAGGVSSTDGP
jgi:eukaryotic-like serine/threonine-protein kinase